MWIKLVVIFATVAILGKSTQAQNVECNYMTLASVYTCVLVDQNIQHESDMLTVIGEHSPGMDDGHVRHIRAENSTVRVFPTPLINRFLNLEMVMLNDVKMAFFGSSITNCNRLVHVNIAFNELGIIPSGIFNNCGNMTIFTADSNRITDVVSNAFQGLYNLRIVSFRDNNIRTLHSTLFSSSPHLIEVNINSNQIEQIEPAVFALSPQLFALALEDNLITSWNSTILANNPLIHTLMLTRNRINTFAVNSFMNQPNLISLSIGGHLETLPVFENLSRLNTLFLNENLLTIVTIESFRNLDNLERLDLSNCKIESVDFSMEERPTRYLQQLRRLSLSRNKIVTIQDNAFSMLTNLQQLELMENQLQRLDANSLRPNIAVNMRLLFITDNRISRIERELFEGVTLLQVFASGNVCVDRAITINDNFDTIAAPLLNDCFSAAAAKKISIVGLLIAVSVALITKV